MYAECSTVLWILEICTIHRSVISVENVLLSLHFMPCRHFWSAIFMSCNFMSCKLVRQFHVLQFHALQF